MMDSELQAIFSRITDTYKELEAKQSNTAPAAAPLPTDYSDTDSFADRQVFGDQLQQIPNGSRFSAGEELILSVAVNSLELANVFAVKTHRNLQLGLGDFLQIIEFPIYVDLQQLSAEGWFYNESNRFSLTRLDDGRLKVEVNRNNYYVSPEHYVLEDDDLYVEIDDIASWFGFDYTVNEAQLSLNIQSTTQFPVEQRLARLNKRTTFKGASSRSVLPLQNSGYQLFSPPLLDIQASVLRTDLDTSANYSVLARHDLAYFNAEIFLSGNDVDSLNAAWLTLSKQSGDADLLGPLRATEYSFGDVTPVNAGFGQTQALSRGFSVANTPLNQLADNRKVNLTGEIQVGWDVELYRNGILIDSRFAISEGRYEFNDVELDFGNNDFEFIFYGPQGQIETRTESYIVDGNTTSAGQGTYRFSLVDVDKSVFNVAPNVNDPTQQGLMASAVFDYGLTDWLSLTAGTSLFEPEIGESKQLYTLRSNTSMGRVGLLNVGVLWDSDERRIINSNFRTRLRDTSYALSHRRTERDDLITGNASRVDASAITMTGKLFSDARLPLSFQNSWQLTRQDNGYKSEYFQNALGFQSRLGSFNNSITWYKDSISDQALFQDLFPVEGEEGYIPVEDLLTGEYRVTGGFQYRKSFGRLHTRFFSNYGMKPESEILSYGGAFNFRWSSEFNTDLRYSYFRPLDHYQWNLGLNWRKEAFHLSANAGYNNDGFWSAGLTLRFSLGYEPMQRRVFTSGRPMAQSGAVAVRTFEDLNMSGSYDEGEPLIENATVRAVQGFRQATTNEAGVAVLTPIYNNVTTDIVVDESTLDGPFMITATAGVAITARPGYLAQVELPVVKAGELEGVVYLQNEAGEEQAAPYIMLNLIDKDDNVVASTRSEYDGFYLFTDVIPGQYRLKVDQSYVDRRGLKSGQDKRVAFSSRGDVIAGVDFVLLPLDSADGYVASAGSFDSPAMLKLYFHILRNKLGNQFVQKPFYIRATEDKRYVLGIAYYEGEQDAEDQAQQACEHLLQLDLSCNVEYHSFTY